MKYLKSYTNYTVNETEAVDLDKIEDMNADELAKLEETENEEEPGVKQPIVVPAQKENS